MHEVLIISREELLSAIIIQNRRTGTLGQNQTFIFLKLLLKLLQNSDIQAQVTTMAEHLSLREDTVDGDEEEEEEQSVVDLAQDDHDDEMSAMSSDEQQARDSQEQEQATSSTSAAPPHAGINPPGKKKGIANHTSAPKALKNLASFGDFKFQSPTMSTRSNLAAPAVAQSNSAQQKLPGGSKKGAGSKKSPAAKVAKGGKKPPVGSKLKPSAAGQQKGKAYSSNESIASCVPAKKSARSRNNVVPQEEAPLNSPPMFDQERFQQSVSEAAAAAAAKATRMATAELKRDHEKMLKNMQEDIRRQQQEALRSVQSPPSSIYNI